METDASSIIIEKLILIDPNGCSNEYYTDPNAI